MQSKSSLVAQSEIILNYYCSQQDYVVIIGGNNGTDPILKYEYFDIDNLIWANLSVESRFSPIPMYNVNGFLILRFDEDGCEAIIFSRELFYEFVCT